MTIYDLDDLVDDGGHLDTFTVCPTHGGLMGQVEVRGVLRWQSCGCRPFDNEWPSDVSELVNLCWTCAAGLSRSGSRWSSFHCGDCHPYWVEQKHSGNVTPVLGPHSLNNLGLISPELDPELIVGGLLGMGRAINALAEWRRQVVAATIDVATPLVTYLELVADVDRTERRAALLEAWPGLIAAEATRA